MANAIYPKWKEAILQASTNSALTGTVKVALVDSGTAAYNAAHDFYDDISAGVVGTPVTLSTGKTYVNGTFDADNIVFTSVSGATVEAFVIYIDTGTPGTSRLIAWIDTGVTGLPVTPNGGNINLNFDAAGIFTL
jgi:hypothetical protein